MWGIRKSVTSRAQKLYQGYAERRGEREDRRSFGPPAQFPFIDGRGTIVKVDRRATPERRLSNIQVKEDHLNFDKNRFSGKKS